MTPYQYDMILAILQQICLKLEMKDTATQIQQERDRNRDLVMRGY